jgi:hypothetical protein
MGNKTAVHYLNKLEYVSVNGYTKVQCEVITYLLYGNQTSCF